MIGRYLINTPTLALVKEGSRQVARTVPIGAVITVDSALVDGNKFIEVTWNDEKVMMFVQDLNTRGEAIEDSLASNQTPASRPRQKS